ncbi:CcmD family protein [Rhodohalobacter sp.]|uniref:CcmD family protein n=1 Tax=Rhodohalobacter sp. TaxID=1974210 RepID=UPI003564F8D8
MKFVQDTASTAVDTLTQSYGDRWDGAGTEESSAFIQFMSSNDLIYVVLGVSLIIWFVLMFVMVRVDRKVTGLEEKLEASKRSDESAVEDSEKTNQT